jgi:hypothetical protein
VVGNLLDGHYCTCDDFHLWSHTHTHTHTYTHTHTHIHTYIYTLLPSASRNVHTHTHAQVGSLFQGQAAHGTTALHDVTKCII